MLIIKVTLITCDLGIEEHNASPATAVFQSCVLFLVLLELQYPIIPSFVVRPLPSSRCPMVIARMSL